MEGNTAEMAVIGALLANPKSAAGELAGKITAEMFLNPMLGQAYTKLMRLYSETGTTDIIPVVTSLSRDYPEGETKAVLAECVQTLGSVRNIKLYAREVKQHYKARSLSAVCAKYALSEPDPESIDSSLEELSGEIGELMREAHGGGLKSIRDIGVEQYQKMFERRKPEDTFRTGFRCIDKIINTLERSNFIILAARPKVGKTALALSIAHNMAKQGKKTGIFSMEMSDAELYERFVANHAHINLGIIKAREITDSQVPKAVKATSELIKLPMYIDSSGYQTVERIMTETRLKGLDVVIIDYIQLMSTPGRTLNRVEELSKITRGIKIMAQELNVVVIALSQLNRNKSETQEPGLSDLRDSGSIEQDANQVWFMWLNGEQGEKVTKEIAFKVAANRSGGTGTCVFDYTGGVVTFEETDKKPLREPPIAKSKKADSWERGGVS